MAYVKTVWTNGATALSAEHMNNIEEGIAALDTGKVDKIVGKGLSEEDFTTEEKEKLSGMSTIETKIVTKSLSLTIQGQSRNWATVPFDEDFNAYSYIGIRFVSVIMGNAVAPVCVGAWGQTATGIELMLYNFSNDPITVSEIRLTVAYKG